MFITCYPSYDDFKNLLSEDPHQYKIINIFIDLKNILTGLFNQNTMKIIAENATDKNQSSSEILLEWIKYVIYHYKYMTFIKKKLNLIFFDETGKSMYHANIFKDYKSNRTITRFRTISDFEDDFLRNIIKKNLENIMKLADKAYACRSCHLEYCEADFIPYALIKRYFNNEDCLNIIYSTDTDMIQCLEFSNTKIFSKRSAEKKSIMHNGNWFERFEASSWIPAKSYVYMKSLVGDKADGIPGIKGIGYKSILDLFYNEDIDNLDDLRVIIENDSEKLSKKKKQDILDNWDDIERNYKLISFEELNKHCHLDIKNRLDDFYNEENCNQYNLKSTMKLFDKLSDQLGL